MVVVGLAAALGLLVYDAIIDVDAAVRRLREQKDGGTSSTSDIVLAASREVRGPMVYATLIVALALLPVFVLEGVAGAFLPTVALAFLVAAGVSMAVALTVTPGAQPCCSSRRRRSDGANRPCCGWLERGLRPVPRRRRSTAPLWALRRRRRDRRRRARRPPLPDAVPCRPRSRRRNCWSRGTRAPGTSLPEMNRITSQAPQRAAVDPGRPQRRRPRRPGGHRRPGRRRELGRDVGQHRPVGRLRRDGRRDPGGHRRLSGHRERRC